MADKETKPNGSTKMEYYIYVFLWLIIIDMADSTPNILKLQPNNATYKDSKTNCEAQNMTLPTPYTLSTSAHSNIPNVWLPLRRIKLQGWHWISGKHYAKKIPQISAKNLDCAQIRTKDGILDESFCFGISYGYLCLQNESCLRDDCIQTGNNNTVSVHREAVTWFQARNSCKSKFGSDLAEFPENDITRIIGILQKHLKPPGHFWIGLTRSLWKLDLSNRIFNNSGMMEPLSYKWNKNSTDDLHDCAIYNDQLWSTSDCSTKHTYICVNQVRELNPNKPKYTGSVTVITQISGDKRDETNDSRSKPDLGVIIGSTVGVILIVSIVAVIVVFVMYKRKTKKQSKDIESMQPLKKNGDANVDNMDQTAPNERPCLDSEELAARQRKSTTLPNLGKTLCDQPPPKPKRTYKYKESDPQDIPGVEGHGYINLDKLDSNK